MSEPLTPDERASINEFAMTQGKPTNITDQLAQALEDNIAYMEQSLRHIRQIVDLANTNEATRALWVAIGNRMNEQLIKHRDALAAYRASKEGDEVGAVEGYRILQAGEVIEDGDEIRGTYEWLPSMRAGERVTMQGDYRRPIRAT